MKRFLMVLLCGTTLLTACKKHAREEGVASPDTALTVIAKQASARACDEVFSAVNRNALSVSTIEGKLQAVVAFQGQSISSKATLRIRVNEGIMISFQPIIGIEVARLIALPKGLVMMDRMNSTYYKMSYAEFQAQTGLWVDYELLESLFLQRLDVAGLASLKSKDFALSDYEGEHYLTSVAENVPYKYTYTIDAAYHISAVEITDVKHPQSLQCRYADFRATSACEYPMSIILQSVSGRDRASLALTFARVSCDTPVTIDTTIPSKYKQGDVSSIKFPSR